MKQSELANASEFTIPEYNIKVLIDSGSTKSFIDIAFNFFPNLVVSTVLVPKYQHQKYFNSIIILV